MVDAQRIFVEWLNEQMNEFRLFSSSELGASSTYSFPAALNSLPRQLGKPSEVGREQAMGDLMVILLSLKWAHLKRKKKDYIF